MEIQTSKNRNIVIIFLSILLCLILLTGCKDEEKEELNAKDENKNNNVLVCEGPSLFLSNCSTPEVVSGGKTNHGTMNCNAIGHSKMTLTYDNSKENLNNIEIIEEIDNSSEDYQEMFEYFESSCKDIPESMCKIKKSDKKTTLTIKLNKDTQPEVFDSFSQYNYQEFKEYIEKENEKYKDSNNEDMITTCK